MKRSINCFLIFIFSCIIWVSCSNKTNHRGTNTPKEDSTTQHASMKFSSLASFSNNKTSALRNVSDFNIKKYVQKSPKLSDWVDIMEYPPQIFICKNDFYFLLSTTKKPTGLDINFFHWIILNNAGSVIADLVSFSNNINNSYKKEGNLHFVVYDYDDEFFIKRQDNLIPIVERDYIVKDNLVLDKEHKFYVEMK